MAAVDLHDVEPHVVGNSFGVRQRQSRESGERKGPNQVEQEQFSDEERKWAFGAVLFSAADIVCSAIIFCTAFKYAYLDNGVSLYCLGIQAVSHWMSSWLVVLRFASELFTGVKGRRAAGLDGTCLLREQRRTQLYREQGLSVFMGLVMLISSAAMLFKAFRKLRFWDKWYLDHADMDHEAEQVTEWLAWVGFIMYTLQAIFRFVAMLKLKICIVSHAFTASVISLVFLFVLGFASSYEKEWSWKAEPIAAIALSFASLFEGVRIVYYYLDDMDTRITRNPRA